MKIQIKLGNFKSEMAAAGYILIGSGNDALVYARSGENTCIKIVEISESTALREWTKWSSKHRSNHYVKVHSVEEIRYANRLHLQIVMDRCTPISAKEKARIKKWWKSVKPSDFKKIPEEDTFENATLRAVRIGEKRGFREDIIGNDESVENIMKHAGVLVVVDPWSEY